MHLSRCPVLDVVALSLLQDDILHFFFLTGERVVVVGMFVKFLDELKEKVESLG